MFSVIFDMDGTLLDTQRICIPAWEAAGRDQGIEGMGEYIQHVCGMNKAGYLGYAKEKQPSLDVDRFYSFTRQYIYDNLEVRYKKGAVELLEFLRANGVKCAVASGSSRESVEHHIKAVGGEKYFEAYVCGMEVEHGKPAPDIFLLTAERMGARPEDCFVFEDSSNGIISAHAAGMRPIGIADVAPFDDRAKPLLWRELSHMGEAVEIFKEIMKEYR